MALWSRGGGLERGPPLGEVARPLGPHADRLLDAGRPSERGTAWGSRLSADRVPRTAANPGRLRGSAPAAQLRERPRLPPPISLMLGSARSLHPQGRGAELCNPACGHPCRRLPVPCGFKLCSSTSVDFMFQGKKKTTQQPRHTDSSNLGTQIGNELALRCNHFLSPQAPGPGGATAFSLLLTPSLPGVDCGPLGSAGP